MDKIYLFYLLALIISGFVGWYISGSFLKKENETNALAKTIKFLVFAGVSFSLLGLFILGIRASYDLFPKDDWNTIERTISNNKNYEIEKQVKNENFDLKTLKFNEATIGTVTVIFTIAGLCLGTLGILWLGHLEETRLKNDRKHNQKVQIDRLKSLLSLGIDLFIRIDKDELDFMNDKYEFNSKSDKNFIEWNGKTYAPHNEKTDLLEYKQHRLQICKYLYDTNITKQTNVLEEIHTIIKELQIIYYEKDIILHDDKNNGRHAKRREIFITLLIQYNEYKNFLYGKTQETTLHIEDNHEYEQTLNIGDKDSEKKEFFIDFIYKKYDSIKDNPNKVFYKYFMNNISKEFIIKFLEKESYIFSMLKVDSINDIFDLMLQSNIEANKFFNIYFNLNYINYINEKKEYTILKEAKKDLEFEEYLYIIEQTFLGIKGDIEAVDKLYDLYKSFIDLYNCLEDN